MSTKRPSIGRGVDQTGRSKKDARHVRFYLTELETVAYRSLPVGARALLVELKALYTGMNNGQLFLSVREAARRLGVGKDAAADYFSILKDRGFIRPDAESAFNMKERAKRRLAVSWVLTEYPYLDELPTRDFARWVPPSHELPPEMIRRSAVRDSL